MTTVLGRFTMVDSAPSTVFTMILWWCTCLVLDYMTFPPSSIQLPSCRCRKKVSFQGVSSFPGGFYEKTVRPENLVYYLWSGRNEDLYNLSWIRKKVKTERGFQKGRKVSG